MKAVKQAQGATPAERVCAQHYSFQDPRSCGRCPIVGECHRAVVPLTRETLDAHNSRLNLAAARAIAAATGSAA